MRLLIFMPPATPIVLSAILPAWDTFDSVRVTVRHLALQTIARHMEIVFVCPDGSAFGLEQEGLAAFAAWSVVEIGEMESRSQAFAEGVNAARGEYVVLCEDHSFPEPGWAEALVTRHRSGDYAVVGPMFENANPENAMSWADFLVAYAVFMVGTPAGERTYVAGHNSCYPRAVLMEEGDNLALALESEYILHLRFAAEGKKLYVEPTAITHHVNFATVLSTLGVTYLVSRVFGGNRAASWPMARRVLFVFAAPVVPFMRFRRIVYWVNQAGWPLGQQIRVIPSLFLCLVASAWGEWVGNLLGSRHNTRNLVDLEFYRTRFSPQLNGRDLVRENWYPARWKGEHETS